MKTAPKLDHIAVAVRDLETALAFYRDMLGLPVLEIKDVSRYGIKAAFLDLGGIRLELMQPLDETEGPVRDFLGKHGEGVHHMALRMPDARTTAQELADKGAWIAVQPEPHGGKGENICFLHPISCHGVTLELMSEAGESDPGHLENSTGPFPEEGNDASS